MSCSVSSVLFCFSALAEVGPPLSAPQHAMSEEAAQLAGASFGETMLHAIGRVYEQEAAIELGGFLGGFAAKFRAGTENMKCVAAGACAALCKLMDCGSAAGPRSTLPAQLSRCTKHSRSWRCSKKRRCGALLNASLMVGATLENVSFSHKSCNIRFTRTFTALALSSPYAGRQKQRPFQSHHSHSTLPTASASY